MYLIVILKLFYLTCFTIYSNPSKLTCETRSTFYMTRAVFTVYGARGVTVLTVDIDIITTCRKNIQFCKYPCALCVSYNLIQSV